MRTRLSGLAAVVLLLSVFTVLVITVANAGALLVADVDRRRPELVVRAALGADRRRLWLMHAVESGTLSGVAGLLGAIAALAGAQAVTALAPASLANLDLSLPVWQTAAVAAIIAAAAAFVCSLFQASRMPWRHLGSALVVGTADAVREHVADLERRGVSRLYAWFADFAAPATLRTFGRRVIGTIT